MNRLLKTRFVVVGVFAIVVAVCSSAQAAILYTDGSISHLEDEDWEALIKGTNPVTGAANTNAGALEEGDLIAGVFKIQQLKDAYPGGKPDVNLQSAPDTFTALFLLSVDDVDRDPLSGGNFYDTIKFAPAAQSQWTGVFGAGGPIDISSAFVPLLSDPGTMIFAFDGVQFYTADSQESSIGASAATFVDGGRLLYEFGFTGVGLEFWTTDGKNASITSQVTSEAIANKISLNVTKYHAGTTLLPHNFLGDLSSSPDSAFTDPAQLQAKGNFKSPNSLDVWPLYTNTDIYVRAIPEPSSMAIAGVLACLFGVGAYRRRPRNGKAA